MALLAALLGSLSVVSGVSPNEALPAHAAAGDGITAYVSPPFVQGPPSSYSTTIENFETWTNCNTPLPVSAVGTFTGTCTATNGTAYVWGGATTSTDTPVAGGTPSAFLVAPVGSDLTLTFTTPMKYFGFWWSAGSAGNTVKIYTSASGASPAATFTTTTLNSLLGSGMPNPYPGSAIVAAINGTGYSKGYYFGRPSNHTSITPTSFSGQNNQSHAYLNIFASGSIAFTKIEFTGTGFEFDNVAISSTTQTPTQNLVFIESVLGKTVTFMANGGDGAMAAQTESSAANLTANSFTRSGHTFTGWHTTISGTGGTSFANQDSYNFVADHTLYAQWTADPTTTTSSSTSTTSTTAPPTTTTFAPAPAPTTTSTISSTTSLPIAVDATTASTPSISAPRQILTGTSITVVARGFVPGESVVMSVGDNGKTRIVTADQNGEVRLTVKLTAVGDGERVTASAVAGSRKASQVIEIKEEPATLPKTGFSPMPTLLLSALFSLAGLLILARRRFMHLLR
jgi:uncharacterized repeat protein (TIGR02543 family)